MDTTTLLEELASNVSHSVIVQDLIQRQPFKMQQAFSDENVQLLQQYLGNTFHLATPTDIVEF